MPNACTTYGLQHCIDNLTSNLHQGLLYWQSFHSQLKNIEGLLTRQDRRQRFVHTCLYGSPFQSSAPLFRKWSQTLYEGRWKEVCKFIKRLTGILHPLRQAWDANKYKHRVARLRWLQLFSITGAVMNQPMLAFACAYESQGGRGTRRHEQGCSLRP